jgi:CRISPR-associated endonuclease/helicase Cas3
MGDRSAFAVRRSVCLRLHPKVMQEWQPTPARLALLEYANESDAEPDEMKARLTAYLAELEAGLKQWPYEFLAHYDELRPRLNAYPAQTRAYVLQGRKTTRPRPEAGRVFLDAHSEHVEKAAARIASIVDSNLKTALQIAAKFHDYGKADVRYQAWLLGGDRLAAQYAPKPVAKSGLEPVRRQGDLPKGFRHELLSLLFAERASDVNGGRRDLVLHLVASHHGRCRPFAPVVADENAQSLSYGDISICKEERDQDPPSRIESGIPGRFWKLTRNYGWWGLAYLEALFRLSDWEASEKEESEVGDER